MGPKKDVRDKNDANVLPDSLGWDAMIRDAKKRIEDLKLAIEFFEKKKAALLKTLRNFLHLDRLEAAKETRN